MSDEKRQEPVEFEPTDFHGTLTAEDRVMMTIQEQLDNLADDAKIRISRVDPVWCAGHLETIHLVDSSQPLDIDAIIKRWGGQRLQIKILNRKGQIQGGGTIACFSYRPRVRGKEITEEMLIADGTLPGPLQAPQQIQQQQPQPNPLSQLGLDIPSLIKLAQGGGKDGGVSAKLIEQALLMQQQAMVTAAKAQTANNPMNNMGQMMEMFEMFSKMKSMFGDVGGGGGGGGGDDAGMMPMLGQLLSGIMQQKQQQQAPSPIARRKQPFVVPPGGAQPQGAAVAPPQPMPSPPQLPVQQVPSPPTVDDLSISEMADKMAKLNPKDAAEVALQAFGGMTEEKRQETMELFMGELFEEDIDETSISTDTNGYGQQINQPQIPGQNAFAQSPGGPLRANEGND